MYLCNKNGVPRSNFKSYSPNRTLKDTTHADRRDRTHYHAVFTGGKSRLIRIKSNTQSKTVSFSRLAWSSFLDKSNCTGMRWGLPAGAWDLQCPKIGIECGLAWTATVKFICFFIVDKNNKMSFWFWVGRFGQKYRAMQVYITKRLVVPDCCSCTVAMVTTALFVT